MTDGIPDFRVHPIDDGADVWVHALLPRGQVASYRLKLDLADVVSGVGLHDFRCSAANFAEIRHGVEQEGFEFIGGEPVASGDVPALVPWSPPEPKARRKGSEYIPDPPPLALFPSWEALFEHVGRGRDRVDQATLAQAWKLLPDSARIRAVMVLVAREPGRPEVMPIVRSCVDAVRSRDDDAIPARRKRSAGSSRPLPGEVDRMFHYYNRTAEKEAAKAAAVDLFNRGDK